MLGILTLIIICNLSNCFEKTHTITLRRELTVLRESFNLILYCGLTLAPKEGAKILQVPVQNLMSLGVFDHLFFPDSLLGCSR